MDRRERGSATLIVIILLGGLVFAVTNIVMLMMTVKGSIEVPLAEELYRLCPACLFYFALAPLVVAVLNALMVSQATRLGHAAGLAAAQPSEADAKPAGDDPTSALQLLALLQQEGRLVDFLEEDISAYDDAQVGAAVRAIHSGCRKALHERVRLERVYAAEDGATVSVESGFDPAAVRVSGNVSGTPPFRGTLQHGGWRAASVNLPKASGSGDPRIIAPAEVEIA
jgi:hypothetical protein